MAILDYEYSPASYPAEVKRGIDFLYEAADRKAAIDAFVDCFTRTGTVVKNDFQTTGHDGMFGPDILAFAFLPFIYQSGIQPHQPLLS